MSPPHWFLGKGQGPLRDGRPSFEEELAKMPPMADSCYRPRTPAWYVDVYLQIERARQRINEAQANVLAPRPPELDEPSPD